MYRCASTSGRWAGEASTSPICQNFQTAWRCRRHTPCETRHKLTIGWGRISSRSESLGARRSRHSVHVTPLVKCFTTQSPDDAWPTSLPCGLRHLRTPDEAAPHPSPGQKFNLLAHGQAAPKLTPVTPPHTHPQHPSSSRGRDAPLPPKPNLPAEGPSRQPPLALNLDPVPGHPPHPHDSSPASRTGTNPLLSQLRPPPSCSSHSLLPRHPHHHVLPPVLTSAPNSSPPASTTATVSSACTSSSLRSTQGTPGVACIKFRRAHASAVAAPYL